MGSWVLVLLATLITLIRSPIPPTTIFTIEAPPQRFSQPMLVSNDDPSSRPYYLGYADPSTSQQQHYTITLDNSSYYKPQYMPLSSPSKSSSYYSTRLPHVDSLSTIESVYSGFQPLKIDLPIIQVGAFDVSFITRQ